VLSYLTTLFFRSISIQNGEKIIEIYQETIIVSRILLRKRIHMYQQI